MRKLILSLILMGAMVNGFGEGGDASLSFKGIRSASASLPQLQILSSVPSGSPLDVDDIKCQLSDCSGYGRRFHPIYKTIKKHEGIDLSAPSGTPVLSTSYGEVSLVQKKRYGYGNNIRIQSGDYETLYAHLRAILVEEGQQVSIGDTIGLVGSTGASTAPHLHYEVRILDGSRFKSVNPIEFIIF